MVVKPEQERVRTLLSDTITLLCRNGLTYKSKFCISALVGITIDEDEVFLVDIRETIKNNEAEDAESNPSESEAVASPKSPSAKRRKRRKRSRASVSSNEQGDNGASRTDDEESSDLPAKKNKEIKQELDEDDDSQDLVFIKDEPGVSDMSSMNSSYQGHSQSYSQPQPQGDILTNLAQQGQLFATPSSDQLQGVPPGGSWDPSSGQQTFAAHPPSTSGAMQGSSSQIHSPALLAHTRPASITTLLNQDKPQTCPVCLLTLPNVASFKQHMTRTHCGKNKCPLCDKTLPCKRTLQGHLVTVHNMDAMRSQCPNCGLYFQRDDVMRLHVKRKHRMELVKQFQPGGVVGHVLVPITQDGDTAAQPPQSGVKRECQQGNMGQRLFHAQQMSFDASYMHSSGGGGSVGGLPNTGSRTHDESQFDDDFLQGLKAITSIGDIKPDEKPKK